MKLIIDGKEYEVDSDFFVDAWYKSTLPYIDPDNPTAKKYTDIRLAAKGLLRVRLGTVLKLFADIFHVADWHDLAPKRGEDMLVKLHSYVALLMRAEGQNLRLEMESESEPDHDTGSLGDKQSTRLTLTRAGFSERQALYQRPDTGREIRDGARPRIPALSPVTSGGGLEPDEDAPEI